MPIIDSQQLKETISKEVVQAFLRRMPGSRPLMLGLEDPEALLHRLRETPSIIAGRLALSQGLHAGVGWHVIAGLEGMLVEALRQVMSGLNLLNWNPRTAVAGVVSASQFAERLRIQLGVPGKPLVDMSRAPVPIRSAITRCADDADKARLLPTTVGKQLTKALWQELARRKSERAGDCCNLRFRFEHDELAVDWLGKDNVVLESERVQELLEPAINILLPDFADTIQRLKDTDTGWEQAGGSLRKCLPPETAHALQVACETTATVGLHLFTATVRGRIPTEVNLLIQPHGHQFGCGGCTLTVDRAHQEFILESIDKRLYYFPPVLLCARLIFRGGVPHIMIPVVRQPEGGFLWRHPYTGLLEPDPFTGATFLNQSPPIMYEPSAWATRTFQGLRHRLTRAGEKDMCLAGQTYLLGQLQNALARQMVLPAGPDALRIVTEIHTILRHGLCHAHQQSTAAPRIRLTPTEMPYVVEASESTPVRIFRYDPRAPSAAFPPKGNSGADSLTSLAFDSGELTRRVSHGG